MSEHLDPAAISMYLDRGGTPTQRAEWEDHLAGCLDCRQEMIEVRRILVPAERRRRLPLVPLAAAAAIMLLWAGVALRQPAAPVTRDPENSTSSALAPNPLSPIGNVARTDRLVWSKVPGATRYRVTLFTAEGQPAWQATMADTVAPLPENVRLTKATTQYWQVKAETGYGRWVESELVEFTITPAKPTR